MNAYNRIVSTFCLCALAALQAAAQPADHATAINAHTLWNAPYKLNGEGQRVGIFEFQRSPTKTHPEFKGVTNLFVYAAPTIGITGLHPTQVTGLILAQGKHPRARGIARASRGDMFIVDGSIQMFLDQVGGWEWDVSCHSYGINRGWRQVGPTQWQWTGTLEGLNELNVAGSEERAFGYYDTWAKKLDSVIFKYRTQIPVVAAGNQRWLAPSPGTEYDAAKSDGTFVRSSTLHPKNGGEGGYDVLVSQATAKNAIVVGAVDRNGLLWPQSSTGPTDDGRIKPDVVALGVDVTVCGKPSSMVQYDSSVDGTSYATPAVAGAVLLMKQQWEKKIPFPNMLASTARGLLIHTAKDLGRPGPDYLYGWGQVDVKAAVDLITQSTTNGGFSVRQDTLSQNEVVEFYVRGNPNQFGRITIAWTDPEGTPADKIGTYLPLNDRKRMLVNDLDLKLYPIINGMQSVLPILPYALDPASPTAEAKHDDNKVDNVEQIYFKSADLSFLGTFAHIYKVTVTGKGTLRGGSQAYSICINGLSQYLMPPTGVTVASAGITRKRSETPQAGNTAVVKWTRSAGATAYEVQYRKVGAASWTTIGQVTLNEAKLENLEQANYQVRIRARNGNTFSAYTALVQFFGGNPVEPEELWASTITPTTAKLNWTQVPGVTQYEMISARVSQNGTALSPWTYRTVNGTSVILTLLQPDQRYACYVRTKYSNNLYSDWSPGAAFYTTVDCGSYEPDNTFDKARRIPTNEYYIGLLCKNDKEDWLQIKHTETTTNLQVVLYEHSKPYRLTLYRRAKSGGNVTAIPGSPPAGIGEKVMTVNGADFKNYDYWIQVWSTDPATIYHESEEYWILAQTSNIPFLAAPGKGGSRKAEGRGSEGKDEGSGAIGALKLYPNPARESATALFTSETAGEPAELTLYDMTGSELTRRILVTSAGETRAEIPVAGLPDGAYLIRIRVDGRWLTQRLNVQR